LQARISTRVGRVLFLTTLALVAFYACAYVATSDVGWRGAFATPGAARAVAVPGLGLLASIALGGYWYYRPDKVSRRVALAWTLVLFAALYGVPLACAAIATDQPMAGRGSSAKPDGHQQRPARPIRIAAQTQILKMDAPPPHSGGT